ncbi:MAG: 30S ribosomal protein S7, partial [Chloroflexi bacterium CG_4_10_14_0_8_um_filter_57_5]
MRRSKPEKREILPDIRYHHIIIQTLIQHMLTRGKKSTATRVMYDSLDLIKERSGGKNPVEVFDA